MPVISYFCKLGRHLECQRRKVAACRCPVPHRNSSGSLHVTLSDAIVTKGDNMTQTAQSLSWMLTSRIQASELPSGTVRVTQLDGCDRTCDIATVNDRLVFNGQLVDVGDDYPCYLGLIDAVLDSASGSITLPAL
jgi:hypothetical protein